MALALAKILTNYAGVSLQGFTFLGVSPNASQIEVVTDFMLCFLCLNHVLTWLGDYQSFKGWNHPGMETHKGTIDDATNASLSKLEYFAFRIKELHDEMSATAENTGRNSHIDLASQPAALVENTRDLLQGASRLFAYAHFYLWGWFLSLPAAATIYALWI